MRNIAILFITFLSLTAFAAKGPVAPAREILAAAPQSANDFFQIGFSAASNGQYDVAIKNYSMAIDIDPNRIYFFYHRGLAHKALGEKNAGSGRL